MRLLRRFAPRNDKCFKDDTISSPDCNGILLGCGRSEAEPVAQKI